MAGLCSRSSKFGSAKNKMLRFSLFCLIFLISVDCVFGLLETGYFPINDEEHFDNSFQIRPLLISKRETENLSAKKLAFSEKKTQLKTSLQLTSPPPLSDKIKTTENPSTSPPTPAPNPGNSSPNPTQSNNDGKWIDLDLPYDLPTNLTVDNDTSTNDTQNYIYYNATFYKNLDTKDLWMNLDNMTGENVITHPMLSNSHRRAATVTLSFDFPFYGHLIRNITLATGGFLYTGDYMHTWLAATQYIAPLMANFDTSIHNDSMIRYVDTGAFFTVEWDEVYLQDKIHDKRFTFQATLFKSGDISFVYKTVPLNITQIDDGSHPVKVGLSDAYIMEKTVVFIRRKTIYEYHRADLSHYDITNNSAIYFTALPTCQNYSDCQSCMASETSFECSWCASAQRCSSGLDRHRQDWLSKECEPVLRSDIKCPAPGAVPTKPTTDKKPLPPSPMAPTIPTPKITPGGYPSSNGTTVSTVTEMTVTSFVTSSIAPKVVTLPNSPGGGSIADAEARVSDGEDHSHKAAVGAGAVISILMIVCLVTGFGIWIVYAYKFPQSPSGQLLIRYRPSQWRWRHGEARYTAASIHI